jgi:hypothetical protein
MPPQCRQSTIQRRRKVPHLSARAGHAPTYCRTPKDVVLSGQQELKVLLHSSRPPIVKPPPVGRTERMERNVQKQNGRELTKETLCHDKSGYRDKVDKAGQPPLYGDAERQEGHHRGTYYQDGGSCLPPTRRPTWRRPWQCALPCKGDSASTLNTLLHY